MSSVVHESREGVEFELYLNETTGVITVGFYEDVEEERNFPFTVFDGSLAYPALRSGYNHQVDATTEFQEFLVDCQASMQTSSTRVMCFSNHSIFCEFGYDPDDGYYLCIRPLEESSAFEVCEEDMNDFVNTFEKWLRETRYWLITHEGGFIK